MCGIVGALNFQGSGFIITEPYIVKMRDEMVHRGPDAAGVWVSDDGQVGLGHRRLSIIDTSNTATQPMSNEDRTLYVSFNGEIYNHHELRKELELTGNHRWKTDHSDTEVILHAFEEWGIDCLQKFQGMFAIALWDVRKQDLWLIRDRVGIKPLYYSIHHGRIVFASEIKALLQDSEQARQVNDEAFFHYLSFLTSPAPHTLFQGVKKLAGGTYLKVNSNGNIITHRYWDALDNVILDNSSEDNIKSRLFLELKNAVQLRKNSDVPVGVFLSGGLDSSFNLALFSKNAKNVVKTFSIGYDQEYRDYNNELHYAKMMTNSVGAEYHELLLSEKNLLDFIPKLVWLQDEPIADPVCVPVYYVSKLARDNGVIVTQVGEGADELFCGYSGWMRTLKLQELNEKTHSLGWMKKAMVSLLKQSSSLSSKYLFDQLLRGSRENPIFWGGAEAFTELQKFSILHSRLKEKFKNLTSWEVISPIYSRFKEKSQDGSFLNWMTYLDLNLRLPELLLMRIDKMSMGASIECREPFLDHKLVEYVLGIPTKLKIKNNDPKYLLKKIAHGFVPNEIINRRKQGFGVPMLTWGANELGKEMICKILKFTKRHEFFDYKAIKELCQNKAELARLWYIYNFVLWMETFGL